MLQCVIDIISSNTVASVSSAAEPWDVSVWCPGHLEEFSGSPGCFCPGQKPSPALELSCTSHSPGTPPTPCQQERHKLQIFGLFPVSHPALFLPVLPCFRDDLGPRWCPEVVAIPGQFGGCVGARALQQLDTQGSADSSLSRARGGDITVLKVVLEGDQLEPS